jgi:hypothetical protein
LYTTHEALLSLALWWYSILPVVRLARRQMAAKRDNTVCVDTFSSRYPDDSVDPIKPGWILFRMQIKTPGIFPFHCHLQVGHDLLSRLASLVRLPSKRPPCTGASCYPYP